MTALDSRARWHDAAWPLARVMQASLVGLVLYAGVTVDPGLVANAGMALAVAALPTALRWRYGYEMSGGLALWIAAAAFLHAVGALGPYETVPGYDWIAHTLSATLVAGAGYAIVSAIDRHHDGVAIPPRLRFVFILLFVLAFGVLWEIAEFASGGLAAYVGGEPALAQYGVVDIVLDLVFDGAGALLVAIWGTGHFDGLSRLVGRRIDRAEGD